MQAGISYNDITMMIAYLWYYYDYKLEVEGAWG